MKFYFDDIEIGQRNDLGAYTFHAEDMIGFARQFDPQPFHLSDDAARRTHFGRLCASGWQTAAVWMKLYVAYRDRQKASAEARGETVPGAGGSPGFRNLRWLKPVFVGDTITYSGEVIEKRVPASKPGWGIIITRQQGINQNGEPVFSFESVAFAARRPA